MTDPKPTLSTNRRWSRKRRFDLDAIFEFILDYKATHDGNSPSIREIMAAPGLLSTSSAWNALRRLERAHKITLCGNRASRRIVVVGGQWTFSEDNKGKTI